MHSQLSYLCMHIDRMAWSNSVDMQYIPRIMCKVHALLYYIMVKYRMIFTYIFINNGLFMLFGLPSLALWQLITWTGGISNG